MKIIVTGSLGHVGKPLTQKLVEKEHEIVVISSNPEKEKDIAYLGARAAIGSLEDVDFLSVTFAGADAVFAIIPPAFAEPDQIAYYSRLGSNYAHAIQRSGVKKIVHLSSYGADLDKGTGFILGSHHVESILNKLSDVAVTHLRAMYIYYNLHRFADMIKSAGFIGSNYGGNDRLVMVDPKDIAAAAAEELLTPVTGRKIRYVASDEHTCNEVAGILGAAIGKPDLKWVTFTEEQTLKGLEQSRMPKHAAQMLVELNAAIHSGIMLQEYDKQKPTVMGHVKVEDFAKEFAAAYKQKELG